MWIWFPALPWTSCVTLYWRAHFRPVISNLFFSRTLDLSGEFWGKKCRWSGPFLDQFNQNQALAGTGLRAWFESQFYNHNSHIFFACQNDTHEFKVPHIFFLLLSEFVDWPLLTLWSPFQCWLQLVFSGKKWILLNILGKSPILERKIWLWSVDVNITMKSLWIWQIWW